MLFSTCDCMDSSVRTCVYICMAFLIIHIIIMTYVRVSKIRLGTRTHFYVCDATHVHHNLRHQTLAQPQALPFHPVIVVHGRGRGTQCPHYSCTWNVTGGGPSLPDMVVYSTVYMSMYTVYMTIHRPYTLYIRSAMYTRWKMYTIQKNMFTSYIVCIHYT
jgi:hypothetical protein